MTSSWMNEDVNSDPLESCKDPLSHADLCPEASSSEISEHEFSCHCCYDILINPTTLNCGHSFCRHCLAIWWESSRKTECPECREKWEGFPKVNILLRDTVEKLFYSVVQRRRKEIEAIPKVAQSLLAFQKYGNEHSSRVPKASTQHRGASSFFSGVLTALTCVAVVLLVYHWSSRDVEQEHLIHKPVAKWTAQDVILWLELLGPWASLYKAQFSNESVNGRILILLDDEELSQHPYSIENPTHRKAVLAELERVKSLGVKPPQNLWEYKSVNTGKSLFLLYALKRSPRLTILYLYFFDYEETFLPFIHTCCPMLRKGTDEDVFVTKSISEDPTLKQWEEFLVKYSLLPYLLIAEFAWDWMGVHYWTTLFIVVNAMLLTMLEICAVWKMWVQSQMRTFPQKIWSHVWKVSTQGVAVAIFWPMIPQFACNCLFYWALYFNPIINVDHVVQQVFRRDT